MPPLPERVGVLIRPCAPLEPSPAGFLAHTRISSTSRSGLLWTQQPSSYSLSIARIDADSATEADVERELVGIEQLVPDIHRCLVLKGQSDTLRHGGYGEGQMRDTLDSLGKHSWDLESYLDGVPKNEILKVIATSGLKLPPPTGKSTKTDEFVAGLAKWFKKDYMKWVDPIPCPKCKSPTRAIGGTDCNPAERKDGGGRVELHQCTKAGCGGVRRFVRYGSIKTLLRTKEGRCGEWAHLFYAFLRVAGVEARYIWNSEDHVWAEYWSPKKEHWVHVDPCEAAVDKPLLYEKGWGKKQSYCLAFGPRGAEDVTAVYVTDHLECETRRRAKGWREHVLALALEQHTISLQLQHPTSEIEDWESMIRKQNAWKSDIKKRMAEAAKAELGGRVSGPEEWRKMRDEMGEEDIPRPKFTIKKDLLSLKSSSVYLLGNAARSGSGVTLTTKGSQTSGVFADVRIAQTASFHASVTFRMSSPPGAGEADGMAIAFSQDRKLGLGGHGLGYSGLGGKGDFAIEIDTYRSQDHADDPPAPHISVHSPPDAHHLNSIVCTKEGHIPYLSNGRIWTLELIFDGASRQLTGWLKSKAEAKSGGKADDVSLWQVTVPTGGDGGSWHVGVTGSCGGLWQKQEVLEWRMEEIKLQLVKTDTEKI